GNRASISCVNPALDSMDETMIHVSDRSVVRFDPIRSWSTNGAAIGRYSRIMAEAERLRQSLLADAGRGDLLKTIIDRVELRPNGLRMILSLVPLTPAAAPPNRLQGCVFTREFPLRIERRGVEMRFAIDAPDPRATNPDPVLHYGT